MRKDEQTDHKSMHNGRALAPVRNSLRNVYLKKKEEEEEEEKKNKNKKNEAEEE